MKVASRFSPLILIITALCVIHVLMGGSRLAFSLPAYALLAIAGLLTLRLPHPGFPALRGGCLVCTLAVFSYLLLRAALSPLPYLARADVFLMLGCVLMYLLGAVFLATARQRMPVVGALLGLGIVHTAVSVVQAAQGEDFMLFDFVRAPSGSRASGMFVNPSHLAGFLEIAGVLGLSVAWWSARKPAVKVFAGWAALCCYVALLLSQSRGGVLSAVASLLVWGALTLRAGYLIKPHQLGRGLILGIGAVTLLLCAGGWFASEHIELRERLATTLGRDIRVSNWQAALAQFRTAPIFGTGAGTHLYLGRLFRQPDLQGADPIHAHSDYLELLAEYGLVGAVGMAALLFLHARSGLRGMGRLARGLRAKEILASDDLALIIGALAAFAAIAAHSCIDFNMHMPGNALVMAFLFGILAQPEAAESQSPGPAPSLPPRARWGLMPLAGGLLVLACLAWPGEFFAERARVFLRDAEYPDAVASATTSLRFDPWNPFACLHLGEALRLQAELEPAYADRQAFRQQAERAFAQGLRLFPQDENLLVRRGQVLDRLRRFEEAEASFQAALAADPNLEVLRELYQKHLALWEAAKPAEAP